MALKLAIVGGVCLVVTLVKVLEVSWSPRVRRQIYIHHAGTGVAVFTHSSPDWLLRKLCSQLLGRINKTLPEQVGPSEEL